MTGKREVEAEICISEHGQGHHLARYWVWKSLLKGWQQTVAGAAVQEYPMAVADFHYVVQEVVVPLLQVVFQNGLCCKHVRLNWVTHQFVWARSEQLVEKGCR